MVLNDAVRELLDGKNPAVLTTLNPDGSPQSSVVWVGREGDQVVISSTGGLRKVQNLLRDPRASLLVIDPADSGRYAELRGTVQVAEDAGREVAIRLAEHYEGDGAGQEYADLPAEVQRVVLRLTPTKVHAHT
ncbi:pyridoxamine 5'-phosphate oxidase-related FMN- binding protein [Kribbella flavida DSM 17836]|uniref:Pyridoxamine 5'-phosphate oxidase-related FMN-binding protein n=1 Tax=Kribbella flavida (strain DSM 17836 / JCM 10339 / NBRC 14399) TaxID=479435 RepID=D2Q2W0_KRIFD|nr:PPOX class F420-dependent oxidoreductase [Kribbella flavida]ADB30291.1 pyridoxamine 5'-phosphate oxidase-related FMN- binding protein [Kribbella flavida DSM 17836]